MELDNLYLELTRNCTLQCEHCLKGEREAKDMSLETIDLIFKDIKKINTLLLSGGEPLINKKALEYIAQLIDEKGIKVNRIGLITNGTICNKNIIEILQELKKRCDSFQFILSSDLFHRLEWDRLNIKERIDNNYEIYKKTLSMKKYLDDDRFHSVVLCNKGRALGLTKDRLHEITRNQYIDFKMKDIVEDSLELDDYKVHGKVFFDVNGNLGYYSNSFKEEDLNSDSLYNIHYYDLIDIINNYINRDTKIKEKEKVLSFN